MFLPTIEFQLSAFGFRSFDRRLSLQCRMHAVSVLIVWIVEISAMSDLRPRGQWPQGHINADWTTCERRQAGCAPDLRQDFRAGGGFKADVGMVERHVPRCLVMRYSVHQAVEVGDGRRQERGTGRQAEALQDFCSCVGRLNCGDSFHPASAR